MCTVTIVAANGVLRVACNRDERRDRLPAHPPFITRAGEVRILSPQDPQGRGTWIAANSAGLVFALLNAQAQPLPGAPARLRSRGLVVSSLADANSLEEVGERIDNLPVFECAPFRLLAIDSAAVAELSRTASVHRPYAAQVHSLDKPLLFTSSSLGDAIVDGPRRMLFDRMFAMAATCAPDNLAARQDAFHAHRWCHRPAVSVHMSRPDACTVSTTTVEVSARGVRMLYQPAHCDVGTPAGLIIERQHAGDAAAHRARGQHAAV